MKVGNLKAGRDFTDVRDIVRGYYLAVTQGEPGEVYNLCSGQAWSIQQILDTLLGMSEVEVRTELDPARLRPSDVPVLVGDAGKFRERTGWEAQIPLEQTLADLLAFWRPA